MKRKRVEEKDGNECVGMNRTKRITLMQQQRTSLYTPEVMPYTEMCVSPENSAALCSVSVATNTVTTAKGYCTARGSFDVAEGAVYFEVRVLEPGPSGFPGADVEPHTRLGWSTHYAFLQTPVGYDWFGFAYRDLDGSVFHQSRRKEYGRPFGVGDVVGCLIRLPPVKEGEEKRYVRGLEIPGSKAAFREKEPERMEVHNGSEMEFFVNGESQGVAFRDIPKGGYFPSAAVYMGAKVAFNFGPEFAFPVQGLRPLEEHERNEEGLKRAIEEMRLLPASDVGFVRGLKIKESMQAREEEVKKVKEEEEKMKEEEILALKTEPEVMEPSSASDEEPPTDVKMECKNEHMN